MIKITLEDKGQDLLWFITDYGGEILKTGPFHSDEYIGGFIPLESQEIGELCMIHHPPNFSFGYLNYKVVTINNI